MDALATPPNNTTSDDEISSEEYQASLMARYSSKPAQPAAAMPPVESTTSAAQRDATATDAPTTPAAPRRRVANQPAPPIDLGSMRELANATARDAVVGYSHRTLVSRAHAKLFTAGAAMAASFALICSSPVGYSITYVLGIAVLLLALVFSLQYNKITKLLSTNLSADDANGG